MIDIIILSVARDKRVTLAAHCACLEEKPEDEKKVTQINMIYSAEEARDFILRWIRRVTRWYKNRSME